MKRILIVSDTWTPQINGVVRAIDSLRRQLEGRGFAVRLVEPGQFRTIPCPTYPEIRLAVPGTLKRKLARIYDEFQPNIFHIVSEGPLGLAARRFCLNRNIQFTTAYHTKFPEYVRARTGVPLTLGYRWMRWFHAPSSVVMVATNSIRTELENRGFDNCENWTHGVDTNLFRPRPEARGLFGDKGPVFMYVGRMAVEKNLDAFLELDLPGRKIMVGDGPARAALQRKYPGALFTGAREGEELARCYAAADVFVFPSLTDTFGLVMLEALASGVPVAAYPAPGPLDVIDGNGVGALDRDLKRAALAALEIDRDACRRYALGFSWERCASAFCDCLRPIGATRPGEPFQSPALRPPAATTARRG